MARRLTSAVYVQAAVLDIMRDVRTLTFAPTPEIAGDRSAGFVYRRDGTPLAYDWRHHMEAARTDAALTAELERAELSSALLVLGDRLAAEGYFDRAPILEMVRHLRNAVGHGNRFSFHEPAALLQWPAHTRDAASRSPTGAAFEITAGLQGTCVLFDFMGPGDVLDVLVSVGTHLLRQ